MLQEHDLSPFALARADPLRSSSKPTVVPTSVGMPRTSTCTFSRHPHILSPRGFLCRSAPVKIDKHSASFFCRDREDGLEGGDHEEEGLGRTAANFGAQSSTGTCKLPSCCTESTYSGSKEQISQGGEKSGWILKKFGKLMAPERLPTAAVLSFTLLEISRLLASLSPPNTH